MLKSKIKIVEKPWGREIWFAQSKKYVGKILIIKKGHRLSKQYHKVKHETIYTDKGKYIMEIKGKKLLVQESQSVVVPPKTIHRMFAKYCDIRLLEVSTPEVWDVVRVEDDYGRSGK